MSDDEPGGPYERRKARARQRSADETRDGTDIGPPPPVADPQRRQAAHDSLQVFCETYFPNRFSLRWSPDHLQILARMEEAICHGGLFALAMPRGSGKTTLAEVACLWAVLTARHAFVMLLAVNATRAVDLLENIKTELLTNDLLAEDFPEVCHPIRALEGRANRAKGQHIGGQLTHIGWRQKEVVFPFVQGSAASGIILRVSGLTGGNVRGQKFIRPHDGLNVRPSLVLLDDPQDDKVAFSPHQVEQRHRLIHGAVLGMAGPGKKVTAVVTCTCVAADDLSDQFLDREKSPLWTGQRYQLLPRFPERMDLWDEYGTKRGDEFRNGGDGHLATAWYGQQRAEMDRGAMASWPERHNPEELSAVQHAMNLYYLDRESFFAEYQNTPRPKSLGDGEQLKAADLLTRVNSIDRRVVPVAATKITAYVDVQQKCLYWLTAAWGQDFSGAVIDYGTYPDQQRQYFSLGDVQRTLGRAAPGTGLEGSIHAGLEKLAELLLDREWKREDGTLMKIEKLLVDANWGASTDTVYDWCRRTRHAALVMPAHGRYVGAGSKPWSEYQVKPGEQLGLHWLIPAASGKRTLRHVAIDTNFWKSFIEQRLRAKIADKGALTFFGREGEVDHRLLADHLTSEYRVTTEGRGRQVDEWKLRPSRPDNHWLDCLTGTACAASMLGISLGIGGPQQQTGRRTASKADFEKQRKAFQSRRGY